MFSEEQIVKAIQEAERGMEVLAGILHSNSRLVMRFFGVIPHWLDQ